jgi:hypothetical protein
VRDILIEGDAVPGRGARTLACNVYVFMTHDSKGAMMAHD